MATQTPPWPTAIPDGILSPCREDGEPSALPSPSVSSITLIRSRPGPAASRGIFEALGDPDPAALVERHGHRIDDVGLGGDHFDRKARRALSSPWPPRRAFAAGLGAVSWPCGIGCRPLGFHSWPRAYGRVRRIRPLRSGRTSRSVRRTQPASSWASPRGSCARQYRAMVFRLAVRCPTEWRYVRNNLVALTRPGPPSQPARALLAVRPDGDDSRRRPPRQSHRRVPRFLARHLRV